VVLVGLLPRIAFILALAFCSSPHPTPPPCWPHCNNFISNISFLSSERVHWAIVFEFSAIYNGQKSILHHKVSECALSSLTCHLSLLFWFWFWLWSYPFFLSNNFSSFLFSWIYTLMCLWWYQSWSIVATREIVMVAIPRKLTLGSLEMVSLTKRKFPPLVFPVVIFFLFDEK
jgi:hypothetical protein